MSEQFEKEPSKTYTYYNYETKREFLEDYPEQTQTTYGRIFSISADLEHEYEKDLYDFDILELKELFHAINPLTIKAAQSSASVIKQYQKWAIDEGLRYNNVQPLYYLEKDWYEQFVNQDVDIFLSDDMMKRIIRWCKNQQDRVILCLLCNGAWGTAGSEIVNLKKTDIDPSAENLIILTDENGESRNIHVSDLCMETIEGAIDQQTYLTRNGVYNEWKNRDHYDLVDNEYVVRNSKTRTHGYLEPAHPHVIYRRIAMIAEEFPLQYFTTKVVQRSGMLKMAKDLIDHDGELRPEHIELIGGIHHFNNMSLARDTITLENIEKVYGDTK